MYIHVKNAAGEVISEGDGTQPLVIGPLNASDNEVSAATKLTIYTDTGFKTYGDVGIEFVGTTADKWTLCLTETGSYTTVLTIATEIVEAGTDFYVKAVATNDEAPANDEAVDIKVSSVICAI